MYEGEVAHSETPTQSSRGKKRSKVFLPRAWLFFIYQPLDKELRQIARAEAGKQRRNGKRGQSD